MRKYLIIATLILASSISIFAQVETDLRETKPYSWPNNRLGGSASMFSGFGLSYQYHFLDKYAVKFSLFGYGESNNRQMYSTNENLYTTVGAEFQFNLHKTRYTRFHAFVASSFWYDDYSNYYNWSGDTTYNSSTIKRAMVFGAGFGFEFLAWDRISFNIETGFQGRFETNTTWDDQQFSRTYTLTHPRSFGFGIGGGITYAF